MIAEQCTGSVPKSQASAHPAKARIQRAHIDGSRTGRNKAYSAAKLAFHKEIKKRKQTAVSYCLVTGCLFYLLRCFFADIYGSY